ncbi:acetylxylan esterase [Geminisphaera colitermitum]|uniref:acetylxylan esterase n=1 Tax=Geminisphaera colitermitum TaxID=1148786 RepID=UPI000158CDDF|nr:acetylxylan esterase [Geminisphaera colitermitum]
MKSRIRALLLLPLFFTLSAVLGFAGDLLLLGKNDKPTPFYAPGEKMTFEIRLQQDGKPVTGTRLSWTRTGDDGLTEKGEALSTAEPLVITTSTDKPGFVRILVKALDADGKIILNGNDKKKKVAFDGGAGVQPEKLTSIPEPADFDAWWAKQKAKLAKIPLTVLEQKPLPETHPNVETFDIKVACTGPILAGDSAPKPVSGYFSKTKNAAPKSAAAFVKFHGYGKRSAIRRDEDANDPANPKLVLDINAHGIENGQPAEFYANLSETTLKNYAFNKQENATPETAYFYGIALRALRALEFIKSQPEWDGKNLTVTGGSQGGFQALLVAGLDPDVTRCTAGKPWVCDLGGITINRLKGWRPDYTRALDYFDPVNHAKRIRADTYITSGLGDYVCPPSGVTVLYNNIPDTTSKRIEYIQGATHRRYPSSLNPVKFVVKNK